MEKIIYSPLESKKEIFFLFIFACLSTLSFSQPLLPTSESAFEVQLPFNKSYIKQNNIKSITFDIIDKKDMQVAEDKDLINYYEFNKDGQLTRFYYTVISKIIQKEFHHDAVYRKRKKIRNGYSYTKNEYIFDTVSTNYFYNEKKQLILKRTNDGVFYESYYYDYNSEGKVIKERRCKETNVSPIKNEFKLGSQLTLSEESYTYNSTGKNQYKKTCLNDENRPYKEMIYNCNDSNKVVNITEQYIVTWLSQKTNFEYDKDNQLKKASYTSNSNGQQTTTKTYECDSANCLLTEKHFKNDLLLKEISYVTDKNKKTTSYIIRDPNEKTIRIVKLFYKYY